MCLQLLPARLADVIAECMKNSPSEEGAASPPVSCIDDLLNVLLLRREDASSKSRLILKYSSSNEHKQHALLGTKESVTHENQLLPSACWSSVARKATDTHQGVGKQAPGSPAGHNQTRVISRGRSRGGTNRHWQGRGLASLDAKVVHFWPGGAPSSWL